MIDTQEEKLLTVAEVATYLRVDTTTVRRWIKAKTLDAIMLPYKGKRTPYRIKESTLVKLLGQSA